MRGDLLKRAAGTFDVFITVDRNLSFQQNLPSFDIAVMVLRCRTNRLAELRLLVPETLNAIPRAKRGEVTWIGEGE